ncbi:MAG: flagellar biosynthesis anti-sigma factor FlgM [Sedimentisphaerales bacterium]|nr:flagellar biosynthesis anti-sigma factor FlgM [Sedimentisphaerales bacterium]
MPEFEIHHRFKYQNRQVTPGAKTSALNEDAMMEKILENLNTTPMGQVLKKIASLPEVRRDKVLNVRKQLTDGKYDLNERLNIALDKVLEDLTA